MHQYRDIVQPCLPMVGLASQSRVQQKGEHGGRNEQSPHAGTATARGACSHLKRSFDTLRRASVIQSHSDSKMELPSVAPSADGGIPVKVG